MVGSATVKIPLPIVFKKFTPATVATTTVALLFDNSFTSRLLLELWIKSSASDLSLGKMFPLSLVISGGGPGVGAAVRWRSETKSA